MSVSATLEGSPKFPVGTVVRAYDRRFFGGSAPIEGQADGGALFASSGTVESNGYVTISGLNPEAQYYAGAIVNGTWEWITFTAPAPTPAAATAEAEEGSIINENRLSEALRTRLNEIGKIEPGAVRTANYTLKAADAGTCVEGEKATAQVIKFPANFASVGSVIEFLQLGVGQMRFEAESGAVRLRAAGFALAARQQYSIVVARQYALNKWVLEGDLAAAAVAAPTSEVAPVMSTAHGLPFEVPEELVTTNGEWEHFPTSFTYQWERDAVAIAATVNSTFGKTGVGASNGEFTVNKESINKFTMPAPGGKISKLTLHVEPGSKVGGEQKLKALVYRDENGKPGALVAEGTEVIYKQSEAAKWLDLPLPTEPELAGGEYWIGFMLGGVENTCKFSYDEGAAESHRFSVHVYAEAPLNPFGAGAFNSQEISVYASVAYATGSANASYKTVPADATHKLRCKVTAHNSIGEAAANSNESVIAAEGALGAILWKGDGSEPLWKQWVLVNNQLNCAVATTEGNTSNSRVSLATTGVIAEGAAKKRAIHFAFLEGDSGCFKGRSELENRNQGNGSGTDFSKRIFHTGDKVWIAMQMYFPSDYPLNQELCESGGAFQVHPDGSEPYGVPFTFNPGRNAGAGQGKGPPHAITAEDEALGYTPAEVGYMSIAWWVSGTGPNEVESPDVGACRHIYANKWYNVLIYYDFEEEAGKGGEVKFFLNGVEVWKRGGPGAAGVKTGVSPGAGYNRIQLGLYPDNSSSAVRKTMDLYVAGFTVATTREKAEQNAFRP